MKSRSVTLIFSQCEERLQCLWACGSALVFLFPPCACETEDFFTLIFSQCTSSHDKCKKKFGKGTMCWNSLWKGKPGTRACWKPFRRATEIGPRDWSKHSLGFIWASAQQIRVTKWSKASTDTSPNWSQINAVNDECNCQPFTWRVLWLRNG